MSRKRNLADIYIHDGKHRSFEWYWDNVDEIRGLDAYQALEPDAQDSFAARLKNWGNLPHGALPSKTQVNVENNNPLILAVKAGDYRFPAFHAKGTNVWIVTGPYVKKSQVRDKRGDAAIARSIKERKNYETRTKENRYYQRNRSKNA